MNILAIDTCTDVASVTLFSSGVKISRMVSDIAKSSGHKIGRASCRERV